LTDSQASISKVTPFACLLLGLGALSAQESPLSIKVDVNLVNIGFVVHNSAGTLARDLTRDDVEVFEDGVKQEVKFFNRSGDIPLRLGLLVDGSDSQDKFLKQHRRDLETFVAASIAAGDQALLIGFNDHLRVVSDFTSSPASLIDAFKRYEKEGGRKFPELEPDNTRDGGTALFDAVFFTAHMKLAPVAGERKAMILFSDGEDNSSAHDLMDAIEAAQSANCLIYTVRYTGARHGKLSARNHYGIREMDRLAEETGAVSFDAAKDDVAVALHQVTEELRAMYEVGYVTTNPARDRLFRKVVIRTKADGLVVRAKPGYYAR
jgi:Ca-activated chloride channel family protein